MIHHCRAPKSQKLGPEKVVKLTIGQVIEDAGAQIMPNFPISVNTMPDRVYKYKLFFR